MNSIDLAKEIRVHAIQMVYVAKASHIGSALSMADILAVLYSNVLHVFPKDPNNPERDRFLLSKGHACVSLYAVLGLCGFFPVKDLGTYGKDGSLFLSHATHHLPGVEISSGSLGHGLPIASGLAIAAKREKREWRTYCMVGDGELDEGANWEAILFSAHHKLDNLCLIVDCNRIQGLGYTRNVLDLGSLKEKFNAFNWGVIDVDGHDHTSIRFAFERAKATKGRPSVIIANTIKGAGVSFMENDLLWHYKSPTEEQYNQAIEEITHEEGLYKTTH